MIILKFKANLKIYRPKIQAIDGNFIPAFASVASEKNPEYNRLNALLLSSVLT